MMLRERHQTDQRNNNARITSGKTSDQGSSLSSNQQLSNRSLLSGKTKDSRRSKRDKSSPEVQGNIPNKDGRDSKSSESASPIGHPRYTSTPVSRGPRNASGLSNISRITIQSNNNARITSRKTSDQGSSPSSNQELSNRSLLSSKTKDSKKSKSGWIASSTKINADGANIPETVPKAKEIRTSSSKTEKEIDKPKRKKSNIPIYTPVRNKSTSKGQAGDRDQRKMIAQGLVKKTNPRHRAEPEGDIRPQSTSRSTSKEAKTMASTLSQKGLQTQQKIINRPTFERRSFASSSISKDNLTQKGLQTQQKIINRPTLERRSFANSSKSRDNLKQERITTSPGGFHTSTDKEEGQLRSRLSSLTEYDDMSSTFKRNSMSVGASSKISGDSDTFKTDNKSKLESASTKRGHDNSSVIVHHTKATEATPSPVNDLDPVQVQKYYALLDLNQKNEEKVDELKQHMELQEQEMDDVYTDTRGEIEKLIGSTAEVVEARRIHRNFKDEATRTRVHHKTNLITAELYTMENIFLQEQIAELHHQLNEAKAINSLTPEELKAKIQEIWGYYNDQKQRNEEMVEQIEKLKDTLNEYRCGGDEFTAAPTMPVQSTQAGHDTEIKPNTHVGSVDDRAGYSKSEDNVANMGWQEGPRETKSDHTGENRVQKAVNTAKALIPNGRQNYKTFTEGIRSQIHSSAVRMQTRPLLHKRHHKVTDVVPATLSEGHNEETMECVPLETKPGVYKWVHQQEHQVDRNGLLPAPHPPAYPCPDGRRSRKLRKTSQTPTPWNK